MTMNDDTIPNVFKHNLKNDSRITYWWKKFLSNHKEVYPSYWDVTLRTLKRSINLNFHYVLLQHNDELLPEVWWKFWCWAVIRLAMKESQIKLISDVGASVHSFKMVN